MSPCAHSPAGSVGSWQPCIPKPETPVDRHHLFDGLRLPQRMVVPGLGDRVSRDGHRYWLACGVLVLISGAIIRQDRRKARLGWRPCPNDWRVRKIQKAAGQSAPRLTDLLTRPVGTGGDDVDTGDAHQSLRLVSETRQNARDTEDVRRSAHNPATTGRPRSGAWSGRVGAGEGRATG